VTTRPLLAVLAAGAVAGLGALAAAGRTAAAEPRDDAGDKPAQLEGVTDVEQLSLADLLDTQVDVASRKPQTTRETPGIVTMITRNDILNSGARDLLDVLALVPGFAPGVDVQGVVDLGIRGQWGHEGKILLQIDGQPMNELLYSSLQLANHYPLESIDRIEVIRGPGSAIHGGYAELAVINIISRDAISLDGVAVAATWGQLGRAIGHANTSLSFGATSSAIPELSVTGSVMIGHASSRGTYRDFSGASYAMHGNSDVDPMFGKLAVKLHGLRVNAMLDNYAIDTRDGVGPVMAETARQGFRAYYLDASYDIALRDHVTLTPRFDVIRQTPWEITDRSSEMFYTKTVSRYTAGLALSYDPAKQVNVLAGIEAHADRAHLNDTTIVGFQTMFGDKPEVAYDTIATYAQLLVNHRFANLTLGARYEHHSAVGGSLVPRIALTKVMGRFHAKLLASQAFRAPGVENINLSNGLDPERTTVFEAEAGYEIGEHMFAAVNAFDTTIKKPIIYEYDREQMEELYQNFSRTGTRGVEVGYRVRYPRATGEVNYSFYTAAGKNRVDAYRVPGNDGVLLGFPAHKVAMSGSVDLYRGLSVNPSAVIYGPRYGYTAVDGEGNLVIGRQAPTALVNLHLRYRDLLVRGFELGAGVYDVADQHFHYLQPYSGGHPPLPGTGRELVIRLAYEHKL
jgi:outer membrane receptor for ferrienterochelin and colicins